MPRPTREHIQASIQELWDGYRPWRTYLEELRTIESPEPMGFSAPAIIAGRVATAYEYSQGRHTEHANVRLREIRRNYVGRLDNNPPSFEPKRPYSDAVVSEKMTRFVQFCKAQCYELDIDIGRRGKGTGLLRLVAEMSAFPGKLIGRVHVRYKNGKDGPCEVVVDLTDPLMCAHDFDGPPQRFLFRRNLRVPVIRKELEKLGKSMPYIDKKDDTHSAVLSEMWCEEGDGEVYRAFAVDEIALEPEYLKDFDHSPWITVSTHSTVNSYQVDAPSGQNPAYQAIIWHAQPFYSSLKHVHYQNKMFISALFTSLFANLNPTTLVRGVKDPPPVESLAPGGVIILPDGADIEVYDRKIQQALMAADQANKIFDSQYDLVVPWTLFGGSRAGDSGFKQNLMSSASETALKEAAAGAAMFVQLVFLEVAHQFRKLKGTNATITLDGEIYTPDDMPEEPMLHVEWTPSLGDGPEKAAQVSQWLQQGIPKEIAWAMGYNMTNSREAIQMQLMEKLEEHPSMVNEAVLDKFAEKYEVALYRWQRARDPVKKKALAVLLRRRRNSLKAAELQLRGQSVGQGSPEAQQQPGPGVSPAEMGANSPDMKALAVGQQSSSTQGNPGARGENSAA